MHQTIERYRRHTKDNETNKPIEQNLQHLKAESANMLKTVEDLEVSRRYWSFYKIQPRHQNIYWAISSSCRLFGALFLHLHLEPPMLLETKDVEPASLLVQSASS
ncbi:hypothetical protein ES319_D09G052000v1 [Gossypium barbadense]|uniref:Uncharacterized protein n=2 Tax=Gossypium TaxID=3633 RepID=A0A5J5PZ73_GOSBA|nr:hypothetical protein ES319_D09G052000v1 [Gossypium barbadense]TYG52843.1 hypothetical protein ES288_D09G060900v1 [Gossypium darwinii]